MNEINFFGFPHLDDRGYIKISLSITNNLPLGDYKDIDNFICQGLLLWLWAENKLGMNDNKHVSDIISVNKVH